jgi:hypothetical protein
MRVKGRKRIKHKGSKKETKTKDNEITRREKKQRDIKETNLLNKSQARKKR